jgi:hypothetical protein
MNLDDLFDGVFTFLRADELRRWDVLFDPVRQVLDDPRILSSKVVALQSSAGPQEYGADALVWVYRPEASERGCDECGAEPGQPCNPVTCCALETLADAAEAARARQ